MPLGSNTTSLISSRQPSQGSEAGSTLLAQPLVCTEYQNDLRVNPSSGRELRHVVIEISAENIDELIIAHSGFEAVMVEVGELRRAGAGRPAEQHNQEVRGDEGI